MFRSLLPVKNRSARTSLSDDLQRESTPIEEINESEPSEMEDKHVEILDQDRIWAVAFLADGKHFVSGGHDTMIRCWRVEDGREVGTPMHAGSEVWKIAVSQDGKWIVAGTHSGHVVVWDAKRRDKVGEFKAHHSWIQALDVSPDGTKIATSGSERDETAHVWALPTGGQLLDLRHKDIRTIKFSPDGRLLATGSHSPLRIYSSQSGNLRIDFQIYAWSLAWASDSKQLFVLSAEDIYCLDVSSGTTLSTWSIRHDHEKSYRISLSSNDAFIAVKAKSLVSFWDTRTHQQIGTVVHRHDSVYSMAMSANYDFVVGGGKKITLWNLHDILSSHYVNEDVNGSTSIPRVAQPQNTRRRETNQALPIREERSTDERSINLGSSSRNRNAAEQNDNDLNAIISSLRADLRREATTSRKLQAMVNDLRGQLADSQRTAEDNENTIKSLRGELMVTSTSSNKIKDLERTVEQLRTQLADCQRIANSNIQKVETELVESQQNVDCLTNILYAHQQKHQCETLFASGDVISAAKLLLETGRSVGDDAKADTAIKDWLPDFTNKCVCALERNGDEASNAKKYDEALSAYATALSLGPSTLNTLLTKWARTMLLRGSTNELLDAASKFKISGFFIYRAICEALAEDGRVTEAAWYLQEMQSELILDESINKERTQWELDFRRRCTERLKRLADAAMVSHNHSEAEEHFSTILSLDTSDRVDILIKRSKVRLAKKSWDVALEDADEVIKLDPSSYRGYEWRRAALHGAKRYAEAVAAYDTMISKLKESPDPHVRDLCSRYTDVRPIIREIIHSTLSRMPRVLIDTSTGQLLDKNEYAEAFETSPAFNELVSSMMTQADAPRIRTEVKKFYRYVMLSHTWQRVEPLYKDVKNVTVYKLNTSAGTIKLQTFCALVRTLGFRWAWCDTCCIDQENNVVLTESLVAMFTWYRGSSLTIIYLFDVPSQLEVPGGLQESIWNTRAWTYQEYVAAERVQFYTQDWKPYLGLKLSNHKDSPAVTREMERASRVSADQLAIFQPGLDRVREKLYLASMRRSTRVEDIAYSLLGIFNVSIPVIYGEGTRAVGRFLEHILTGSGDVKILAWTGTANEYNSCLPMNLSVYSSLVPPHVPHMETAELDRIVTDLHASDMSLAYTLYNGLHKLPLASLASTRLQLPCIRFHVTHVVGSSGLDPETSLRTYRATTTAFGEVEIRTARELTTEHEHCFVHPWIRPLLDQDFSRGVAGPDIATRALRLVARLRRPFGTLFLEKVSPVVYQRVAADSLIMVRIRDEVPLTYLIDNVETINVK